MGDNYRREIDSESLNCDGNTFKSSMAWKLIESTWSSWKVWDFLLLKVRFSKVGLSFWEVFVSWSECKFNKLGNNESRHLNQKWFNKAWIQMNLLLELLYLLWSINMKAKIVFFLILYFRIFFPNSLFLKSLVKMLVKFHMHIIISY